VTERTKSIRDYDRPADRIRQHRQADARPAIVVEGPSDARILRESFVEAHSVFPVGSRNVALEVVAQLVAWTMPRVACVVDRDFDEKVAEAEALGLPVHAYMNADLEAMLCQSAAFRYMIQEVGSEGKLKAFGGIESLVDRIYGVAVPVARLRAGNAAGSWELAFDKVDLAEKVDLRTLTLKTQSYCSALANTSQNSPGVASLMSVAQGVTTADFEPSCPRGSSPYFRGRDFLSGAGVALRRNVGSCERAASRAEHLAGIIRAIASGILRDMEWSEDLLLLLEQASFSVPVTEDSGAIPEQRPPSNVAPVSSA
jgi:hypothetical protein